MELERFLADHQLPEGYGHIAQKWFIPLAEEILTHKEGASTPFFVGVNGCQGSGKSTLCDFLKFYLEAQDHQVVVLSLDDFYLSQPARATLAEQVHPLLATRGVPGTHDTELAQQVFTSLQQGQTVALPRFNKATDNPYPTEQWPVINNRVDIVLMEGWCWGVPPQDSAALAEPVNSLEQNEDPDGRWRHYVNDQLASAYQPLFDAMQYWVMLKGPSFDHVYQWRCEQEHKLIARLVREGVPDARQQGMTDAQISRFIQHYQRLTEQGFAHLPQRCHTVFELDGDRQITGVQKGNV